MTRSPISRLYMPVGPRIASRRTRRRACTVEVLMEKKFTNGADREVVVKLYTNVAERCI